MNPAIRLMPVAHQEMNPDAVNRPKMKSAMTPPAIGFTNVPTSAAMPKAMNVTMSMRSNAPMP